eukprot:3094074-Rhodomonas_salina.1
MSRTTLSPRICPMTRTAPGPMSSAEICPMSKVLATRDALACICAHPSPRACASSLFALSFTHTPFLPPRSQSTPGIHAGVCSGILSQTSHGICARVRLPGATGCKEQLQGRHDSAWERAKKAASWEGGGQLTPTGNHTPAGLHTPSGSHTPFQSQR